MKYILTLGLFFAAMHPGFAAEKCIIDYVEFEASVPHFDLEDCPADLPITSEQGFCRLALNGMTAVIYGFEYTQDNVCLRKVKEMPVQHFLQK